MGRTKARSTTYKPSLAARIDRALYRLRNANGLPLRPIGDDSDPEPVLRACNERLRELESATTELAAAVTEQVGAVQTDRLADALGRVSALLHE